MYMIGKHLEPIVTCVLVSVVLSLGMLTEVFAIVNNRHLPPEQRILLSPNPVLDRRGNLLIRFLAAAVALFLEWAVYGLFVLPTLKRVLQRA